MINDILDLLASSLPNARWRTWKQALENRAELRTVAQPQKERLLQHYLRTPSPRKS
jgi:hypothetical protein